MRLAVIIGVAAVLAPYGLTLGALMVAVQWWQTENRVFVAYPSSLSKNARQRIVP